MAYLVMFIIMCLLDWKLDTYAFFKFIGTMCFGLILFIGSSFLYAEKQYQTGITTEKFLESSLGSKKKGRAINAETVNIFYYTTNEGTKEFNSDCIKEFKEGKENKIEITTYTYPKSAKFWFLIYNDVKSAKVEYKQK